MSPETMVFITLRFLSSDSFLQIVGDLQGVDKSTVSRTVAKVIKSIAKRLKYLICFPNNVEEKQIIHHGFYTIAKLPNCVGALDCTNIKIISPGNDVPENYRNRKGFFSYNVQAICDANLQLLDIVCRWPGPTHDSTIFANSRIRTQFESGTFRDSTLVGDSGYGIKPYLITPLLNPNSPAEQLYNEAQIKTGNPIERCFGIWKRHFPILALGIRLVKSKVEGVVIATAALHNLAIMMKDPVPTVDEETEVAINLTNNINIPPYPYVNEDATNNVTRLALIRYYKTFE